jgi:hypothetical protein
LAYDVGSNSWVNLDKGDVQWSDVVSYSQRGEDQVLVENGLALLGTNLEIACSSFEVGVKDLVQRETQLDTFHDRLIREPKLDCSPLDRARWGACAASDQIDAQIGIVLVWKHDFNLGFM